MQQFNVQAEKELRANNVVTIGYVGYKNRYDVLQLVSQRRLRQGLSLSAHFRLAHATLDTFAPWDPSVIEHLDAAQDARRAWVLQANYELPWARSATGLVGAFVGGWQINAVANWQTGVPFGVPQLDGAGKYRR